MNNLKLSTRCLRKMLRNMWRERLTIYVACSPRMTQMALPSIHARCGETLVAPWWVKKGQGMQEWRSWTWATSYARRIISNQGLSAVGTIESTAALQRSTSRWSSKGIDWCAKLQLARKQLDYIDGMQHRASRQTWSANTESTWFVLASKAG